MTVEHDHDDDGNCVPSNGNGFYDTGLPNWRFSLWDMAGVSTALLGAVVGGTLSYLGSAVHQGANMLAREFQAAANFSRQTKELEEAQRLNDAARRQMSEGLEQLMRGEL